MLSYNAMQKGSAMARGGDIRNAQAIVKNFKRKMQKNISSEAQMQQFSNYSASVNQVYANLNVANHQQEQI